MRRTRSELAVFRGDAARDWLQRALALFCRERKLQYVQVRKGRQCTACTVYGGVAAMRPWWWLVVVMMMMMTTRTWMFTKVVHSASDAVPCTCCGLLVSGFTFFCLIYYRKQASKVVPWTLPCVLTSIFIFFWLFHTDCKPQTLYPVPSYVCSCQGMSELAAPWALVTDPPSLNGFSYR